MTAENGGHRTGRRLQSWKEVAAFFNRDERTIRRWETSRGLPIHRVPGGARGTIYAYTDELEAWLRRVPEEPREASVESEPPAAPSRVRRHWPFAALAAVLILTVAAVTWFERNGAVAKPNPAPLHTVAYHPNPKAVALYRNGIYYWQARTPESLNLAVDAFTQAIVQDPKYAEAYVGLANCYNLLREFSLMPPSVAYPRAEAAARRAIALNPNLADAHASLAFVEFYWLRQVPAAKKEFERALALNPNAAVVHHWYATSLMTLSEFPKALAEIDKARDLDPESSSILADRGLILFYDGKVQEAIDSLHNVARTEPDFLSPHTYLMGIDLVTGDDAGYLSELKKSAALLHDKNARAVAEMAERGWKSGGRKAMLEAVLSEQRRLFEHGEEAAYNLAETAGLLGKTKLALSYLKISVAHNEAADIPIGISHCFRSLRGSAEYRKLVKLAFKPRPSDPAPVTAWLAASAN